VCVFVCGSVAIAACGRSAPPPRTAPVASIPPSRARGLGLTRDLPAAYRRVCAKQAAYAPAGARLCPPLIPGGRLKVIDATPFSKRRDLRGGFLADIASRSLDRLGPARITTNGGHWHYDVSWSPAVRRLLVARMVERPGAADRPSDCHRLRLGGQRVEACRVVPYERGGGLHGGHIAYVWTHGRVTFVISLHGYANEPRARAMTEALMARVLGS
jgi:hypothetical protein